ncbi:hypothetical protein AVEN_196973-1 [Araneus ventricosus]|uniref:Uncharacterized protein n=1 Tax=Araneus ventricosus TaxID=182803 RepID=A0A4Y2JEM0_ARAVE|nr:hypothetical protein AVEN_196973-1 [Araneus ventricosus]
MASRIQMKETSTAGATGCRQPGKKKAKEREFSVGRLHISPLVVNPPIATSWFTITASQALRRSEAWWSELRSESLIRIRYNFTLHAKSTTFDNLYVREI